MQHDDEQRQYNWERGQIDYLGADSFENILSRLNAKLNGAGSQTLTSPGETAIKSAQQSAAE
jgi:hypothetical protein